MKVCTLCGEKDQSKFANNTKANYSTYCIKCTEKCRASGNKHRQSLRNAQIRKGLK